MCIFCRIKMNFVVTSLCFIRGKFCFIYVIIYFTVFCISYSSSQSTNLYVNQGDTLELPCTADNDTTASWEGPCFTSTTCTTTTNTTTYFDGLIRNRDVPLTMKIKVDNSGSTYDLQISNVSRQSTGNFICIRSEKMESKQSKFEVILRVKPSNLVIENAFDGKITGTAGVLLDLKCRVTSGVPLENMTWYKDQAVVKTGGHGLIIYSYIPTRENNGQKFSCVVQSEALDTVMEQTVYLNILYRPVVECVDETISVVEGDNLTVQCLVHSNPPPTHVKITRYGVPLKQCPQSPCSLKLKSSRRDSGIYQCTAQNQIGNGSNCHTNVNILYPPTVSVVILNDTTIRCNATGEPNNATYLSWQHSNELGEEMHSNGSEYLELCSSCKRYKVNGLYRCSATNGIRHNDGNNVSSGNATVQLKGTPEILPNAKSVQYGKYMKPVLLEIFVYSVTTITIERILRNGEVIESSGRLALKGRFKNQHEATHEIGVLHEMDFANYTFELKNDKGVTRFTVSLESKDIPETPNIKHLTVKDSSIMVEFSDNFDGGLPQLFVLQYRSILNWTNVEINDTFEGIGSYTIQNLEAGYIYYFRIYSVNSVGKSNFSEVLSIKLPRDPNRQLFQYVVIATGIIVILVVTTLITRKVETIKTCWARRNNNEENDSVHEQQGQNVDALAENQLYLAFDSLPRNPQQNANLTRPTHVVAQNHGENSVQSRNLHYADLEFNLATQRFFIRGDDRTIYSEIDHALVAPPLESSDSEEEDKKKDDEDDFMSVEEVAELMRGKCMKPALDD